jgi:hypothetical protein
MIAARRSELFSLVKSIVRLLRWGVRVILVILGVLGVFTVFPLQRMLNVSDVQTSVAFGLMFVSLIVIAFAAKGQHPNRKAGIAMHAGIMAACIVAVSCVPPWSGYIVATLLVLFALMPNVLHQLAIRRNAAGYQRSAAFYARLARLFQPFGEARFYSSYMTAQALGSIERKVDDYRALALRATPEQFALLNCSIALAQDDWEGVLAQIRSAGDAMFAPRWLEIRALGEIGWIDEMITTYASAEAGLPANDLPFCRMFVLAFSGRADAVRSLLSRQLRFVRPRNKAYWIFVAGQRAGARDEDARQILAAYVHAADDETFSRMAQRHLDARPTPWGSALSSESSATIAAVEKGLG